MPIAVKCGKCGKAFSVGDNLAGKQAKCPCGGVLNIPAPAAARAPQPQARPQPRPQPPSALASFLDEELSYEKQKVADAERQELERQYAAPQAAPMGIHAGASTGPVKNQKTTALRSQKKRNTTISLSLGIPGLLLNIGGGVVSSMSIRDGSIDLMIFLVGLGVGLLGSILLVVGLCFYAKSKGQAAAFGLLGLLGIIGLIVLACLPDKLKE